MVHEVYNSLFFSSNFLFPLEGKCHVVAKGCTGQSSDVILYRYPDRQSAASLATSWFSPLCKQVALVLKGLVHKKSALWDWLSVSYGKISIMVISHLRWLFPPLVPYGTTFPPAKRWDNKTPRSLAS